MLQLDFQLTEKEFLDYTYYTGWEAPEMKGSRTRFYISLPLIYLVVVMGVLLLMDNGTLKTSSIVIAGAGLIVAMLIMKTAIRSKFNAVARKMIEKSGVETVLPKMELFISDKEILGRTPVAEVKYSWKAFRK